MKPKKVKIEKIDSVGHYLYVCKGGSFEGMPLEKATVVSEYGGQKMLDKINEIIDVINSKK
jgi:hypothetical protein